MSIRAKLLRAGLLAGAMAVALTSPTHAQLNICDSQATRVDCSVQCCGRKACPPACEADCVRACVTACKNPAQAQAYSNQMRAYQQRCGKRNLDPVR